MDNQNPTLNPVTPTPTPEPAATPTPPAPADPMAALTGMAATTTPEPTTTLPTTAPAAFPTMPQANQVTPTLTPAPVVAPVAAPEPVVAPAPTVAPIEPVSVTPEPVMTLTPAPVVAPVAAPEPVVAPAPAPTAAPAAPAEESTEGKGAGKYQVRVINSKCIGAASCVAVAPKAFKLNDKQIAEVLASIDQETDDNLLLAAQSCPTLAIEVIDTTTGAKVWPK